MYIYDSTIHYLVLFEAKKRGNKKDIKIACSAFLLMTLLCM